MSEMGTSKHVTSESNISYCSHFPSSFTSRGNQTVRGIDSFELRTNDKVTSYEVQTRLRFGTNVTSEI